MCNRWGIAAIGLSWAVAAWAGPGPDTLVLPRPAIEKVTGSRTVLAAATKPVGVSLPDAAAGPLAGGVNLLDRRLKSLGYNLAVNELPAPQIILTRCDEAAFSRLRNQHAVSQPLEPSRRRQAYHLAVQTGPGGTSVVNIQGTDDLGLYYGLVSLCQLLERDPAGSLGIPSVEILDWPEISNRIAKVSGSGPPKDVAKFAALLPFYKISQIGVQYHARSADSSKRPISSFVENVTSLCPRLRREGTLESIVYFCPFRGVKDKSTGRIEGAFDFTQEADKTAYAEYLLWIMAQGAHGIEVDYNDWPGSAEVPISDVLNLAYQTVRKRYPDAYLLYCPPGPGKESYIGMPSAELVGTLSRVPQGIWPLWTGLHTLIREPLAVERVETYAKLTGRRPFLWVNRVGLNVEGSFSIPVPGHPDGRVFAGDRLPKELNRLFEGVHFNTSLLPGDGMRSVEFNMDELIYFATAADFVWNPHGWVPEESYRRAARFVEVMIPLQDRATTTTSPSR